MCFSIVMEKQGKSKDTTTDTGMEWKRKPFFMNRYGTGTSSFSQVCTEKGTGTGVITNQKYGIGYGFKLS